MSLRPRINAAMRTGRFVLSVVLLVELVLATAAVIASSTLRGDALPAVAAESLPAAPVAKSEPVITECPKFGFSGPSSWSDPNVNIELIMDKAVEAGAKYVRMGIEWDRIEVVQGQMDWSSSDRMVNAARAHSLEIVGLLHTTPAWARDWHLQPANEHTPPENPMDFANFAKAAAERYAPVVTAWEVWNEPNIADFWFPRTDHLAYVELLRATYPALKSVNPAIPVLAGALAPSPKTPWSDTSADFLASMYAAGAKDYFDAISQHPYPPGATPNGPTDIENPLWTPLRVSRELMEANGDGNKQLWITEFGLPTGLSVRSVPYVDQARVIGDFVAGVSRYPWIGPVFVHTVQDEQPNEADAESNFGVFRFDGSPKAAAGVLREISTTCAALR